MSKRKKWKHAEDKRESGGYAPMAYIVLRSQSFSLLSAHAVKLMMDLVAQYKGDNNGDLCAAWTLMEKRGWRSRDTLSKARRGLLKGEWIIVTRQGGKHKPTLYALTFYNIDECRGKLDVEPTHRPPSNWRKHEPASPVLQTALKKFAGTAGVSKTKELARQTCQRRMN